MLKCQPPQKNQQLRRRASHAKSGGFILVTNNTKEFERVEELLIENWV